MTRKNGKAIELALETAGELPGLRADERKLKQILVNLLSNAIKFTDPGGKVTLRAWCRVDSGYVYRRQIPDARPWQRAIASESPLGQERTLATYRCHVCCWGLSGHRMSAF